jgi:DNA-binding beta-propeller fold protein YncE
MRRIALESRFCAFMCAILAVFAGLHARLARAEDPAPLMLEAKIPLGQVVGRIDHLAFDPMRQRVYVAELGNDSVGIVNLAARRVERTVQEFDEPQGIAYEPTTDAVYVANGGDGSVRVRSGADFAPLATLSLGDDADNVRVDRSGGRVLVGYGSGALAVIDAASRKLIGRIRLKGHPESFQLYPQSDLVFVNVPEANEIAVVSRDANEQTGAWRTGSLRANFPLALDAPTSRVIAVFRRPPRLQAFDMRTGDVVFGADVCADSDDVFVDSVRRRVYVICGQGYVDVLDAADYRRLGRFATSSGSRTGLYIPELDRLLVAIRATAAEPAAVWVLRPRP